MEGSNLRAFPGGAEARLMPQARLVASIEPTTVRWLSPNRVAAGKITIMDGDPGLGKSTIALDLVARLTRGRALPGAPGWMEDGPTGIPRGVLLMSAEDGESDTIRPRLDAAGADTRRVAVLKMVDEEGNEFLPQLGAHLWAIEQQVEAMDAALLVIDPLMAYMDGEVNTNRDQDVRRVLSPLASMAERTGCAILVLRHLNKAMGMSALYRGGGSIGIIGAARVGLLVHKDNSDETGRRRLLMCQKNNIGPEALTLLYQVVGDETTGASRIEWLGETSITTAEVMAEPIDHVERADLSDAEAWLIDLLQTGSMPAKEVFKLGRADGYNERTLKRARAKAGIKSDKTGFGKDGGWVWALPEEISHARPPAHARPVATDGAGDPWQGD